MRVWDANAGRDRALKGHTDLVRAVALSRDGQCIVSVGDDKSVRVWNTSTGQLLRTLQGHSEPVYAVAVSRDGQRIVSGSADRTVRIWSADTGQLLLTLQGHAGDVGAP